MRGFCARRGSLTVLSLDAIVPRVPSAILRLIRDAQPDALAVNSADVAKEDVHIAHHTARVRCVGGRLLLVAELVPRKAADRVGVARVDAAAALSAEVREDEVRVVKGEVGVRIARRARLVEELGLGVVEWSAK